MLFRVISFSKACTIHPGTLGSICDHKAHERVYEEIKREEDLDNPPKPGGSSSSGIHVDAKVEDVAPDIAPASPSYNESLGVSHGTEGTRKVVKRRFGLITLPKRKKLRIRPKRIFPTRRNPSVPKRRL